MFCDNGGQHDPIAIVPRDNYRSHILSIRSYFAATDGRASQARRRQPSPADGGVFHPQSANRKQKRFINNLPRGESVREREREGEINISSKFVRTQLCPPPRIPHVRPSEQYIYLPINSFIDINVNLLQSLI